MFWVDHAKKSLHIAIKTKGFKLDGKMLFGGLIYDPSKVFNKLNELSEREFVEFFQAGAICNHTVLVTEMGPGELLNRLEEKFGISRALHIGGIIAPFSVREDRCDELWLSITKGRRAYMSSQEKKIFA